MAKKHVEAGMRQRWKLKAGEEVETAEAISGRRSAPKTGNDHVEWPFGGRGFSIGEGPW